MTNIKHRFLAIGCQLQLADSDWAAVQPASNNVRLMATTMNLYVEYPSRAMLNFVMLLERSRFMS